MSLKFSVEKESGKMLEQLRNVDALCQVHSHIINWHPSKLGILYTFKCTFVNMNKTEQIIGKSQDTKYNSIP